MGVTWEAGGGHLPPGHCHMTDEMEVARPAISWIALGAILPQGVTIPAWGLMSLIGSTWCNLDGSRGRWLRITCPLGRGQLTAEPQVAQPAPSCITVGAILPRGGTILVLGLMSLIGSNWGAPGGSHGRRGSVTCPLGRGHVTAEPEGARWRHFDCGGCILGSGWPHPGSGLNEPHWELLGQTGLFTWVVGEGHETPGSGHMTAELEVARPACSWIAAGAIFPRGGAMWGLGLVSLIGSTWGNTGVLMAWVGVSVKHWVCGLGTSECGDRGDRHR